MNDFPFFITKFEKHEELKHLILSSIKDDSSVKVENDHDVIYQTDWYVDSTVERKYLKLFFDELDVQMKEIFNAIKHDDYCYQTFWFQRYKKHDTHSWHQHRGSSWASIYFLELDSMAPKTIFKNVTNERIFMPDVEEGDIITFPGFVWHCSPPNESENLKTIIAFNVE
jgi:hypothetical protein